MRASTATTCGPTSAPRATCVSPLRTVKGWTDEAPAEQRMQVLRRLRAHSGAEAGGEYEGCGTRFGHVARDGWGARIRTWDRGTKTRCLTTWLRPTICRFGVARDASALGHPRG